MILCAASIAVGITLAMSATLPPLPNATMAAAAIRVVIASLGPSPASLAAATAICSSNEMRVAGQPGPFQTRKGPFLIRQRLIGYFAAPE